ncbi:MAG: hypothetical protein AUI14_05685 [Actinobacteria bacterium 13_2_20CM_2_71_6]|nr:MAG: hypothetical protein AUI14_05685 [Actinobacteria bacterium 13_2_20CM_2_71_6]
MRLRVVLAALLALTVLAGLGIYLVVRSLSSGLPIHLPVQECVVNAGGKASFEPEQMANAATIAAVGIRRAVPTEAITVALATALQESKLQNLHGGDRDSIGLFQQRPSQGWGTADQIADPRYASGRFYTVLLKVKGWQQMTVAQAAQAVQKSADGTAYARWEDKATILATALTGDATSAVGCTITDQPAQRGTAAASALAEGVAADWGQVRTVSDKGVVGLALAVSGTRVGWQYAHWLVSHAADLNIQRVRYADQVWTAKAATWSKAGTPATDHVIAEVYT